MASCQRTFNLGRTVGAMAAAGTIVLLKGELGAGKTVLVKGLAAGLSAPGEVTSPTFVICALHRGGRLPLAHIDLYRLADGDLFDAGLDEVIAGDALVAIEWPSAAARELALQLPGGAVLSVAIDFSGQDHRHIEIRPLSDSARALCARLDVCDGL